MCVLQHGWCLPLLQLSGFNSPGSGAPNWSLVRKGILGNRVPPNQAEVSQNHRVLLFSCHLEREGKNKSVLLHSDILAEGGLML